MKYPPQIKTYASSIALLGALGIAGQAQAGSTGPGDCPVQTGGFQTSAVISADPVQLANDNWQYSYRVCNTSGDPYYGGQVLIDWELPYFDDAMITNVVAPDGWSWSIEEVGLQNPFTGWGMQDNNFDGDIDDDDAIPQWTVDGDPWKDIFDAFYGGAANNPFNTVEKVLHFYWTGAFEGGDTFTLVADGQGPFCDAIFAGENCVGFGFESPFNAGDAPYQASWQDLPVNTGDPLFPLGDDGGGIPYSPSIQRSSTVPEPGVLALLGAGLPLLAMRRRRKS